MGSENREAALLSQLQVAVLEQKAIQRSSILRHAAQMNYYTHYIPVDRVAARVMMKTPWWAKYDPPAKAAIILAKPAIKIEDIINITKPPPDNGQDHRGETHHGLVVMGYADTGIERENHKKAKPPWWKEEIRGKWNPNARALRQNKIRYWWVCDKETGDVFRAAWHNIYNREYYRAKRQAAWEKKKASPGWKETQQSK